MNIKTKPAEIIWDDASFSIDLVAFTGHKKMNFIWGGTGITMQSLNTVPGNMIYTTNTTSYQGQMNTYMNQIYGGISAAQGQQLLPSQQANALALRNVYQSTPTPQFIPNPPKSWVKWWK